MTKLNELGRLVAQAQDAAAENMGRDERAAQRFARQVAWSARGRTLRTRFGAVVLTAVTACVVVAVTRLGNVTHLSTRSATPAVGEPLVAADGQKLPLSFPDGSQVVIGSGAAAVVHQLSSTGANVEVARGEASFAVPHKQRTSWSVGAGPYHVRVTGTRFSVSWVPVLGRFELRLAQGSVVVATDVGSHAAVTMSAPASLLIDGDTWQLSSPDQAEPVKPAASVMPDAAPAVPLAVARGPASTALRVAPGPTWEQLAREGRYRDAYVVATQHGIPQLAETQPSRALLSLAEVCRFSGHAVESGRVLLRLRARFAGTDDGAVAAFQLGRQSPDAQAVNWFRTYLDERPDGGLAREASGRLLEALSGSGDRKGAEAAAEAYLTRYPDGLYASFARQLVTK